MGFGYLALSTKSEQDNYLIGNPQFTYFKAVYRKHTNFSIDYQLLNFPTDVSNLINKKMYINIPKNGDLLHKLYLMFDISSSSTDHLPPFLYNFIEYIEISIGGQLIDKHYSEWFAIWHDLFEDKCSILNEMVSTKNNNTGKKTLTLPLIFWFNRNIGLSLPLIALQNNDVKLVIQFKNKDMINRFVYGYDQNNQESIGADSNVVINNLQLLAQFIHLEESERRNFTSNNHEYLITQVQSSKNNPINNYLNLYNSSDFESINHKIDVRFNYPVKEIYWGIQDIKSWNNTGTIYYDNKSLYEYNYWNNHQYGNEQMGLCNILINGKELMDNMYADFFRNIQLYKYHKGNGIYGIEMDSGTGFGYPAANTIKLNEGLGIYSYSFSLYPEEFQPSGSLNFSKLDNIQLRFTLKENPVLDSGVSGNGSLTNKYVDIYAVNYNVLRIMSGMAGLAFIN